jgi:hypothetical protein
MAEKTMQMGLGEALSRLLHVETLKSRGLTAVPEQMKAERDLIIEALNTQKLDLGFDCDGDGVPDSIQIFAKSAQTACCRLTPTDTSRKAPAASPRKAAASPRRKKTE